MLKFKEKKILSQNISMFLNGSISLEFKYTN